MTAIILETLGVLVWEKLKNLKVLEEVSTEKTVTKHINTKSKETLYNECWFVTSSKSG